MRTFLTALGLTVAALSILGCEVEPSPCIPAPAPDLEALPVTVTTCTLNDTQPIPCTPTTVECPDLPPGSYRMVIRSTILYRDELGQISKTETGSDQWIWTVVAPSA